MEGVSNIVTTTVSEDREYGWYVEYKHDANMGATCVEGFLVGILGWKVKDSMKNESLGDASEDQVWYNSHYRHSKTIPDVDGDVCTGELGNAYVLTVCVWNDECLAERQSLY